MSGIAPREVQHFLALPFYKATTSGVTIKGERGQVLQSQQSSQEGTEAPKINMDVVFENTKTICIDIQGNRKGNALPAIVKTFQEELHMQMQAKNDVEDNQFHLYYIGPCRTDNKFKHFLDDFKQDFQTDFEDLNITMHVWCNPMEENAPTHDTIYGDKWWIEYISPFEIWNPHDPNLNTNGDKKVDPLGNEAQDEETQRVLAGVLDSMDDKRDLKRVSIKEIQEMEEENQRVLAEVLDAMDDKSDLKRVSTKEIEELEQEHKDIQAKYAPVKLDVELDYQNTLQVVNLFECKCLIIEIEGKCAEENIVPNEIHEILRDLDECVLDNTHFGIFKRKHEGILNNGNFFAIWKGYWDIMSANILQQKKNVVRVLQKHIRGLGNAYANQIKVETSRDRHGDSRHYVIPSIVLRSI